MLKHRKDAERVPAGFLLFGQYFDAVFLYQYHVLDLCGKTVIDRIDCPVVILVHKKVRTAFVDPDAAMPSHTGKASDFGSTRNVLHRTDMTYMIRVLRAADWEQHANSGIKK